MITSLFIQINKYQELIRIRLTKDPASWSIKEKLIQCHKWLLEIMFHNFLKGIFINQRNEPLWAAVPKTIEQSSYRWPHMRNLCVLRKQLEQAVTLIYNEAWQAATACTWTSNQKNPATEYCYHQPEKKHLRNKQRYSSRRFTVTQRQTK